MLTMHPLRLKSNKQKSKDQSKQTLQSDSEDKARHCQDYSQDLLLRTDNKNEVRLIECT